MGAVFVQPGGAAERGCSDCVIMFGLKKHLTFTRGVFLILTGQHLWASPLFWPLSVAHRAGTPTCENGKDTQAHSVQASPFSDEGSMPRKGKLWLALG